MQRAFSFAATKLKSPLRACLRPPGARNPNNPDGAETLSVPTSPPWAQGRLLGQLFGGSTPAAERSPHRISTQTRSAQPWLRLSFAGRREMRFWAPERTFPGAKESGSRRSKKSSGKVAAPRMGESLEASVQAVPSEWATDHLGVPSAGASAPGTRGRGGERGPLSAAGAQRRARPGGGRRGLGFVPGRELLGAAAALPTPERAFGLGLQQSKCLPHAGRQGGAGAASRCAAAPGRRRTEARGVWGSRRAAAARALRRKGDSGDRAGGPGGAESCPFSTGAGFSRRGGRHSQSPREAGGAGDRRLLGHRLLDAREAAPCTATAASAAPPQMGGEINSPSSCRRQEEPWTPALVLPEAAKLWARPRWLAVSSRFASGTGQVAGVWEGGSG